MTVSSHHKSKPGAVVFGWFGSSEHNVAKYTDLYHRMGFDTMQYTPPLTEVMTPSRLEKQVAASVSRIEQFAMADGEV